ncbi:MAG TPA: LysE family translocator [Mesorhizobium sp.]|jgi:threonine/homoserine/homoserine lactone efflux protein|nr:LysE family translocator [Mesorhizobium sp.]
MPSTDILITFFLTSAVFAFIPGPSMLYAAAQTMAGGRRSGLMSALGIHVGCYVHIMAAAAGLSALFHAIPWLYLAVKTAGAIYLIWLGVSLFRAKPAREGDVSGVVAKSGRRAFLESIVVEVLNPKTAIFFFAFLPQFVDASAAFPLWLQLLILGVAINVLFSAAEIVFVCLAGLVVTRMRQSSRVQRLVQQIGGAILVGLGVRLALQKA